MSPVMVHGYKDNLNSMFYQLGNTYQVTFYLARDLTSVILVAVYIHLKQQPMRKLNSWLPILCSSYLENSYSDSTIGY